MTKWEIKWWGYLIWFSCLINNMRKARIGGRKKWIVKNKEQIIKWANILKDNNKINFKMERRERKLQHMSYLLKYNK